MFVRSRPNGRGAERHDGGVDGQRPGTQRHVPHRERVAARRLVRSPGERPFLRSPIGPTVVATGS